MFARLPVQRRCFGCADGHVGQSLWLIFACASNLLVVQRTSRDWIQIKLNQTCQPEASEMICEIQFATNITNSESESLPIVAETWHGRQSGCGGMDLSDFTASWNGSSSTKYLGWPRAGHSELRPRLKWLNETS